MYYVHICVVFLCLHINLQCTIHFILKADVLKHTVNYTCIHCHPPNIILRTYVQGYQPPKKELCRHIHVHI